MSETPMLESYAVHEEFEAAVVAIEASQPFHLYCERLQAVRRCYLGSAGPAEAGRHASEVDRLLHAYFHSQTIR